MIEFTERLAAALGRDQADVAAWFAEPSRINRDIRRRHSRLRARALELARTMHDEGARP